MFSRRLRDLQCVLSTPLALFLPVLPTPLADSISIQSTPLARLATLRLKARRRLLLRSQAERKAPTSGQTGRKEAAGKGLIGTRFCIPRMRGPEPRQRAVVPGPPDPVPSAH